MLQKSIVYFISSLFFIWNVVWTYGYATQEYSPNDPYLAFFELLYYVYVPAYCIATLGILLQIAWLVMFAPLAHFALLIFNWAYFNFPFYWNLKLFFEGMFLQVGPYIFLVMIMFYVHGWSATGPFLKRFLRVKWAMSQV